MTKLTLKNDDGLWNFYNWLQSQLSTNKLDIGYNSTSIDKHENGIIVTTNETFVVIMNVSDMTNACMFRIVEKSQENEYRLQHKFINNDYIEFSVLQRTIKE